MESPYALLTAAIAKLSDGTPGEQDLASYLNSALASYRGRQARSNSRFFYRYNDDRPVTDETRYFNTEGEAAEWLRGFTASSGLSLEDYRLWCEVPYRA